MIESLYNKHLTDTLSKALSENFKPVSYMEIKEDITKERQYTNEYSVREYAIIQEKEQSIFENKRPILEVFIKFIDNTAFKMYLEPEDYLGKIHKNNFTIKDKISYGLDVNNYITNYRRNYDFNKLFNTILSKLRGKQKDNLSFELLDNLPLITAREK